MGLFGPPNINKLEAKKDVLGLIKALDYQKESDVRHFAACALGRLGDSRAVESLITALGDNEWHVRTHVAEALGEIGDPRAVEPLITALGDNEWRVRTHAAAALGEIGDPRAVKPLIRALGNYDQMVSGHAAEALGKIGDSRAVESLIAALGNDDSMLRKYAAKALGKIGDSRAIKPLFASLGDKDRGVRKCAEEAIASIDWQPDRGTNGAIYWIIKGKWDKCIEIGEPAVEPLIPALGDNNSDVRKNAATALGQIGNPRAVTPLINATRDIDLGVRQKAVEALGQIGDPSAVFSLIVTLGDVNSDLRKYAAVALDKIGWQPDQGANGAAYWIAKNEWDRCIEIGESAVNPLITALGNNDTLVRYNAARALGQIGNPQAIKSLVTALNDQQINVRASAFRALKKMHWEPDERTDLTKYQEAKAVWEKAEHKKQSALLAAQNWWEGRPFPKTASGDPYICDVCNGLIREKENTSKLGSWIRCRRCTENLFDRWEQGKD
jgi:HEAT repeat protein